VGILPCPISERSVLAKQFEKTPHTSQNGIACQSSESKITLGFGTPAHSTFPSDASSGCIFEIARGSVVATAHHYNASVKLEIEKKLYLCPQVSVGDFQTPE
jgi:hypothetical protein